MRQIDEGIQKSREREYEAEAARARILRMAESQKYKLAAKFEDLLGEGGPPDETAEDMIRAVRKWRDTPSNRSLD